MEKSVTKSGRPRPARDNFSRTIYAIVALMAVFEFLALFWLDLF